MYLGRNSVDVLVYVFHLFSLKNLLCVLCVSCVGPSVENVFCVTLVYQE